MSERPNRPTWLGRAAAGALLAAPAIELAGRSMARMSPAERLTGSQPSTLLVVLVAALGAGLGLWVERRRGRIDAHALVTWQWIALGVVAGLAGTIRWQNVIVALVFGRSARPAEVGVSQDRRTLAAAIDWIRVAVVAGTESR